MKLVMMLSSGLILLLLSACSSMQPILYPNTHFLSVGKEIAEQDINACEQLAKSAGAKEKSYGKSGDVASSTVMGAGVGAASGAAGGAVTGAAGTGSMVGAVSGAVWGLMRGLLYSKPSQPDRAYANFVNRCLQEKGYEVTGWQ
ncbi:MULTISPECIES: glycine zipper family protein [Nitrosomonas]|uniref:Membrane protein n=2 Tax=Nitrosomonas communis TaxID=44574 RepID=A0A0F7KGN3_9PROT|nr:MULTISPECIES: glycine zipper family protein [Nitrosomonas]AKH38686.1 membrane protein [Nitrosomonas communis]TYP89383.1 OmpA family protein [Nitrosomonas communis]UVS60757.1 glycine zipper family protein [Nitrosomonas sp. PLL12]